MASADQELGTSKPKGTLFYSGGANLCKYDFSTGEKQTLFSQRSGLVSNREITNVDCPNYLKNKNRIISIGYGIVYGSRIFECDLNGNNWMEYESLKNIHTLSASPDGSKIAFGRYIKPSNTSKIVLPKDYRYQLVIKKYDELNKSDGEQIIVGDFLEGYPVIWESEEIILYCDFNWNTVRVDLKSGEKKVVLKDLAPAGITNDREFLLCTDRGKARMVGISTGIYLAKTTDYTPVLLKKFSSSVSSQLIWSPDKRYFIFSRTRLFSLNEIKDIWIYDLKAGKEKLLIKSSGDITGGFWLE